MAFYFDHWEIDDCLNKTCTKRLSKNKKRNSNINITNNNYSIKTKSSKRLNVSYATTCKVILVPAKEEYIAAGIELWYKPDDQKQALMQVNNEIQLILNENPAMTISLAMVYLFQPKMEHYSILQELKRKRLLMKSSILSSSSSSLLTPLRIVIIDDNIHNSKMIMNSIYSFLTDSGLWEIYFQWFSSSNLFTSFLIKSLKSWNINKDELFYDTILIDESILLTKKSNNNNGHNSISHTNSDDCYYDYQPNSLNHFLQLLRAILGSQVLIGLYINGYDTNSLIIIEEALNSSNIDFIWKKNDYEVSRMLPLLLSLRRSENLLIKNKVQLKNEIHDSLHP